MRMLVLIVSLCGSLYAQTPAQWWQQADSSQKAFAAKCYEFGKQYGRGHTLAAIAWVESSLGRQANHKEHSTGPFGISNQTREAYRLGRHISGFGDKRNSLQNIGGFENEALLALQIFEDNIRYFRRLGYSPAEAWFWAYPRYNAGKNWRRFRRRGEVFNERVKYLKEVFKWMTTK